VALRAAGLDRAVEHAVAQGAEAQTHG
jgi:hypothetical protein